MTFSSLDGAKDLGPLIGALDQGTSSTKFLVFAANTAELITYHQMPVQTQAPKVGFLEQDPMELIQGARHCIEATVANLIQLNVDPADVVAIGIANQRETTVVWDKVTGQPFHHAIVWSDTRCLDIVQSYMKRVQRKSDPLFYFQPLNGLPFSSYFSVFKLRWLIDNVPEVRWALEQKRLLFGTIDTWLLWNLTRGEESEEVGDELVGAENGLHLTDVTNASRTFLMNLETLQWDPYLLNFFDIPLDILPTIRSCSEIYGKVMGGPLDGVPISGMLGDQQAALVGQNCFQVGQVKNTCGSGCFMLYNVGPGMRLSENGLISTVAFQLGPNARPFYALEGSIGVAGSALTWLKDNLNLVSDIKEIEKLALKAETDVGVVVVPAFSGLLAPHWHPEARGLICGLSQYSSRDHVCRATLESVAFQTRDVLDKMKLDCECPINSLLVDGGMSQSDLLVQLQADILGIPIKRPSMAETTALGAAVAAGIADGIDVWDLQSLGEVSFDTFYPKISEEIREVKMEKWCIAMRKARPSGYLSEEGMNQTSKTTRSINASIPLTIFSLSTFLMLKIADILQNQTGSS
ncbi:hypothetical protein TCAL_00329 [Tigriopus californicus]|uniref:Probable glycerol kinase n=1 Tax=Tigriopus californicus TaxID=6832 RepID=A0A553NCE9_TIGCA|nr:glycerol kinase-like [Tigriopus californicus]TRY63039.1 hypothetical protein TCAL_00329 [Tigriopus californicus]|eukprot:TCALIF_00329-PA protein Name:"Similar to GK3P Putative glycerol kinase 3 (Homo sapiens)" AED:0.05 eAED:0.05 QI:68/1/1/1/0.66/0.75/4/73/577